ncbi:MAG: EAL domain-containing protein, partial [Chromatiales bacterium]|nr:EAL domain-containing protein [Chromatiales bacterium]
LLRVMAALLVAATLLSWLFFEADAVSTDAHHEYTRKLRELRQADTELNAAMLTSRFGVDRDFDLIVATVGRLHGLIDALNEVPRYLPAADGQRVAATMATYRLHQQDKALLIDDFKREMSVLRNSLAWFPIVAERLIAGVEHRPEFAREVGSFSRGVLSFAQTPDPTLGDDLERRRQRLLALGQTQDRATAELLQNTLLHAGVIVERKPVLDALTRDILEQPTAALAERMSLEYAHGFERATRRAHHFRLALYILALMMVGYLALTTLRLGRASQDLARSNRDLEAHLSALQRTQTELRLYATVFTNATEGMMITDAASRIVAVNPAFTTVTGYTQEEVVGQMPSILRSGRQGDDFYREMWQTLQREGQWQGEIWNRRRNGEVYPEWLSITTVFDQSGSPTHYIGVFSDISDRKEAEARIHHLAYHDALTNLPNRVLLHDRLGQAILQSRRSGRRSAVLFLDLDRFKNINDSLGHEVGDMLLVTVARRCLDAVRETDTVTRQGGDEFVIVLPDIEHTQDAALVARKILAALESPIKAGAHELTVTGSVGIALHPEDGQTVSMLLRNADAAMYQAKANGRNGFQFYSADMNTASLGGLLLENQLRSAIERDELLLYYQPKFDARSSRIVGVEALLRWRHPELGLTGPERFIPVAEESGLILPIGEWVLRAAARQLRAWLDQGHPPVVMAVNISAHQFRQQDLPGLTRALLAEYRLPPQLLEFELTETLLMHDVGQAVDTLADLRKLGVQLSIDDFGTGYSSLAYLEQFDVHTLKIDRRFISDIRADDGRIGARSDAGGKIAVAVIALGHSLGQQVVAEGVETAYQRDFLLQHDCDQLQGFLFAPPLPASEIAPHLTALADDVTAQAPHARSETPV